MAEDKWAAWNAKGNSKKGSNWSGDNSDYKRIETSYGDNRDEEDEEDKRKKKEPGMFEGLKKMFGG